jgi:hypothetical protein
MLRAPTAPVAATAPQRKLPSPTVIAIDVEHEQRMRVRVAQALFDVLLGLLDLPTFVCVQRDDLAVDLGLLIRDCLASVP